MPISNYKPYFYTMFYRLQINNTVKKILNGRFFAVKKRATCYNGRLVLGCEVCFAGRADCFCMKIACNLAKVAVFALWERYYEKENSS